MALQASNNLAIGAEALLAAGVDPLQRTESGETAQAKANNSRSSAVLRDMKLATDRSRARCCQRVNPCLALQGTECTTNNKYEISCTASERTRKRGGLQLNLRSCAAGALPCSHSATQTRQLLQSRSKCLS